MVGGIAEDPLDPGPETLGCNAPLLDPRPGQNPPPGPAVVTVSTRSVLCSRSAGSVTDAACLVDRYMYWTDWVQRPSPQSAKISKAAMDGSGNVTGTATVPVLTPENSYASRDSALFH